jgi:hypothetical protein
MAQWLVILPAQRTAMAAGPGDFTEKSLQKKEGPLQGPHTFRRITDCASRLGGNVVGVYVRGVWLSTNPSPVPVKAARSRDAS